MCGIAWAGSRERASQFFTWVASTTPLGSDEDRVLVCRISLHTDRVATKRTYSERASVLPFSNVITGSTPKEQSALSFSSRAPLPQRSSGVDVRLTTCTSSDSQPPLSFSSTLIPPPCKVLAMSNIVTDLEHVELAKISERATQRFKELSECFQSAKADLSDRPDKLHYIDTMVTDAIDYASGRRPTQANYTDPELSRTANLDNSRKKMQEVSEGAAEVRKRYGDAHWWRQEFIDVAAGRVEEEWNKLKNEVKRKGETSQSREDFAFDKLPSSRHTSAPISQTSFRPRSRLEKGGSSDTSLSPFGASSAASSEPSSSSSALRPNDRASTGKQRRAKPRTEPRSLPGEDYDRDTAEQRPTESGKSQDSRGAFWGALAGAACGEVLCQALRPHKYYVARSCGARSLGVWRPPKTLTAVSRTTTSRTLYV